jgi:hypothetical protein
MNTVRAVDSVGGTKRTLSPVQQRFLEVLQRVRYGRIHHLEVRGGEPVLSEDLRWTRTVKVMGDNTPHPAQQSRDFELRREFTDLFQLLAVVGDGEVTNLEVRNGLPFTFELTESLAG